jgi:hypothetical protein
VQLKLIRIPVITTVSLLATSLMVHGQTTPVATATEHHAVLVELFTSEGCSSCPPADALLRQIDGKVTESGQLIVGVSEHVTYWNNLGWSDPFSAAAYTERQNSYGARFQLDSVYTPQIVVNGEKQVLGSDRNAVLRAVREADRPGQTSVHIVSAAVSGNALAVTYSISGSPKHNADLFAVIAEDVTSSDVLRGENSGRHLSHVSVARDIKRIGSVKDATNVAASLPLIGEVHSQTRHLILFAQEAHFGPVLSVDVIPIR